MFDGNFFLAITPHAGELYFGKYDPIWVVVSVLLAILASFAALSAVARVDGRRDAGYRRLWTLIAALTLGVGIWAMHFIGMLALELPCGVYYDPTITLISMIPGILASWVALGSTWAHGTRHIPAWLGSLLLGSGIGAMHYSGMAALRLDGLVRYDPTLFAVSIFAAVVLSYLALFVKERMACTLRKCDFLVAVIMGAAVSWMHYTAMFATYFVRGDVSNLASGDLLAPSSLFTTDTVALMIAIVSAFLALGVLALSAISRNREMTEQLRESEERWKFALDGSGDGAWDWNPQTDEAVFSKRWKAMLGYAEDEFAGTGQAWVSHLHPEDSDRVVRAVQEYFSSQDKLYSVEFRMRCKDGSWKWILARGALVSRDEQGRPLRMIGTHTDISERKRVENELRIAATAFQSQEGIIVTDAECGILRVNQAFTRITGYTLEEVRGQNPRILSSGRHDKEFFRGMWRSITESGGWEGEVWNRRKNGEIFPEHLAITAVKGESGVITNYVGTLNDITASKAAENEIRNLAFYDPLTHLPNRRLLLDRLKHALATSERSRRSGALIFLDLDNFKTLNDSLGHAIGDLLLQEVAHRLEDCVREGDTVARLGGDEFVVICEGLSADRMEAAEQAELVGENILDRLNLPYSLNEHEFRSTSSLGASLFLGHLESVDELMKQADIAMYQSKRDGRNTLRFYDPEMQEAINARLDIEGELHKALEGQQFRLYYQTQVDVEGRVSGAESLIRWVHPERGFISPAQFIPLAEDTGLILPIGQWVLETACAQLHTWQQESATRDLVLSVNVSAKQFRQPEFVSQVRVIVQRHGIRPGRLKLELTESMLLENIEDVIVKMSALKQMGVLFSLDDFGTGYSSLQYLKRLPLDQLKIDQSFVRDLAREGSDRAIVRTIIAMAHSLNLEVIAEGVESEMQRQVLMQEGCRAFQGYLFGKPMPVEQLDLAGKVSH